MRWNTPLLHSWESDMVFMDFSAHNAWRENISDLWRNCHITALYFRQHWCSATLIRLLPLKWSPHVHLDSPCLSLQLIFNTAWVSVRYGRHELCRLNISCTLKHNAWCIYCSCLHHRKCLLTEVLFIHTLRSYHIYKSSKEAGILHLCLRSSFGSVFMAIPL